MVVDNNRKLKLQKDGMTGKHQYLKPGNRSFSYFPCSSTSFVRKKVLARNISGLSGEIFDTPLTNDIKSSIIMTNDKNTIHKGIQTYKYSSDAFKKKYISCQSWQTISTTVWNFWTTGIPIYFTGAGIERTLTDSRKENSFYSQASCKVGRASKATGEVEERIFKCYTDKCFRTIFQKNKEWAIDIVANKFVCFMFLIVWQTGNCLKHIISWFQERNYLMIKMQYVSLELE